MGVGYAFGCLSSLLFWKIDRQLIFKNLNSTLEKKVKIKWMILVIYIFIVGIICFYLTKLRIKDSTLIEVYNAITAFLVLDISNTERKNLNKTEKIYFYNSISCISRSLVCGFVAPLFYILFFGNSMGIIFMLIYNISLIERLEIFKAILNVLNILPAKITELFLYLIYVYKYKKLILNPPVDYRNNTIPRPLLNVDVMAAYIEGVNFYYYYEKDYINYMKCYGKSNNKIDDKCIKNYLGIEYGICLVIFIIFYIIIVYN